MYLTNSIEDLKKVHKAVEQPTPASGKHEIRNTDQGEPAGGPPREVRSYGTFTGHTGPVWALAIGDGLLMSGSSDSTIKVWDLTTSKCKRTLSGHEGIVHAVAVRGEHVISGSSDNKIKVCFISLLFLSIYSFID